MNKILIALTQEQYNKLTKTAKNLAISKSQVIRYLIVANLENSDCLDEIDMEMKTERFHFSCPDCLLDCVASKSKKNSVTVSSFLRGLLDNRIDSLLKLNRN